MDAGAPPPPQGGPRCAEGAKPEVSRGVTHRTGFCRLLPPSRRSRPAERQPRRRWHCGRRRCVQWARRAVACGRRAEIHKTGAYPNFDYSQSWGIGWGWVVVGGGVHPTSCAFRMRFVCACAHTKRIRNAHEVGGVAKVGGVATPTPLESCVGRPPLPATRRGARRAQNRRYPEG